MDMHQIRNLRNLLALLLSQAVLAGCLTDSTVDTGAIGGGTGGNTPPTIQGSPSGTVPMESTYSFTPQAQDADNDPLTFSIGNKPVWLDFDTATGRLTGTPQLGNVGLYQNIEISVTDGVAVASLPAFSIRVQGDTSGNSAPQLNGNPSSFAAIGVLYRLQPTASDADNDPLTFSIQNLPGWASFDTDTGELSGIPQAGTEGTYGGIVLSVTDGVDTVSLPAFAIIVSDSVGDFPELVSIPEIPFDAMLAPGAVTSSGSLPSSISAGEVLQFTSQSSSGDVFMTCNGTEADPAFIVGGTLNGSNDVITVDGQWCYFVGTVFNNIQLRAVGNNMVFRDIEVVNVSGKNGSSFGGSNNVLMNSEIHHNQGDDRHGIHVRSGADSIWILGNYVHHNGGDGFQACHGCSSNPPRNVYIGNNLFHSDRENAIDFKYIENVIVEGNIIHSLVSAPADQEWCFDDGSSCGVFSSGSDGSGIVIGSDGGPTNVLIKDNEIFSTVNATRIEEGIQIRVEGNNFHDLNGRCLQLDKDGFNTVYVDNSCVNAERGIFQNWRDNFSLTVDNNVFQNISSAAVEYESNSVANNSTLTNNMFDNAGPVVYGNLSVVTEVAINALPNASGNEVQ